MSKGSSGPDGRIVPFMARLPDDDEALLLPAQVAALFHVDVKTVARWAKAGRLAAVTTPGGHRRYKVGVIRRILSPEQSP